MNDTRDKTPKGEAGAGGEAGGWTESMTSKSSEKKSPEFEDGVVLEASILVSPIVGREKVLAVISAATHLYESLVFTHDGAVGSRKYLEWEATAFGGTKLFGVTVLEMTGAGSITRVAIHHRPLVPALRFSSALRESLRGLIDQEHFYSA